MDSQVSEIALEKPSAQITDIYCQQLNEEFGEAFTNVSLYQYDLKVNKAGILEKLLKAQMMTLP